MQTSPEPTDIRYKPACMSVAKTDSAPPSNARPPEGENGMSHLMKKQAALFCFGCISVGRHGAVKRPLHLVEQLRTHLCAPSASVRPLNHLSGSQTTSNNIVSIDRRHVAERRTDEAQRRTLEQD